MKKLPYTLAAILVYVLALTGCGSNSNADTTTPSLSQTIVGTWTTKTFNEFPVTATGMAEFNGQTGTLIVNSDLTTEIQQGTVGFFPTCNQAGCSQPTATIEIIDDRIIKIPSAIYGQPLYSAAVDISANSITVLHDGKIITMTRAF